MGMSIDEIIQGIQIIKAQVEWEYPLDWQIVLDGAIDTMRKYQNIEEIMKETHEGVVTKYQKIEWVLEDGKETRFS